MFSFDLVLYCDDCNILYTFKSFLSSIFCYFDKYFASFFDLLVFFVLEVTFVLRLEKRVAIRPPGTKEKRVNFKPLSEIEESIAVQNSPLSLRLRGWIAPFLCFGG